MKQKKLVLFDIDGTLVRMREGVSYGIGERIIVGIKKAYGIDLTYKAATFEGLIEREIVWRLVSNHDVTRKQFLQKFPTYLSAMVDCVKKKTKDGPIFIAIAEAVELVKKLDTLGFFLGVLTGNAQNIAGVKLSQVGLSDMLPFGIFGDEADDRIALAKSVQLKAKNYFGIDFAPTDVVIIGDTHNDVAAARAIGARVIGVTSGPTYTWKKLEDAKPDLFVETLADRRVLDFLTQK